MGALSAVLGVSPIGRAAVVIAMLAFLRWLIPFVFLRFDVSRSELGKRLKHVERELEFTREALFVLLQRMVEKDPADPSLRDVSRILRGAWPVADPDQDLIDRLKGVPSGASA